MRAAKSLAEFDKQCLIPQRKAVLAAIALRNATTNDVLNTARPLWQVALPALDKQLAENLRTQTRVNAAITEMMNLDKKAASFNKSHYAVVKVPTLQQLITAARQFNLYLQADRWQRQALRDYFDKLVRDSEGR